MQGVGLDLLILPPLPCCEENVQLAFVTTTRPVVGQRDRKHSSEKTSIAMWLCTKPPSWGRESFCCCIHGGSKAPTSLEEKASLCFWNHNWHSGRQSSTDCSGQDKSHSLLVTPAMVMTFSPHRMYIRNGHLHLDLNQRKRSTLSFWTMPLCFSGTRG